MKKTSSALALAAALMFIPALAEATQLSDLTAAGATNTLYNGSNTTQTWNWNLNTGGEGLALGINTTGLTSTSEVLYVTTEGANANSGIASYAGYFDSSHSGTSSTNYGIQAVAGNGTSHNYAVAGQNSGTNTGDAAVWGDNGGVGSGVTYAIYGTTASSVGYAGYFDNSGGGYSAAFMGGNVGIGTATPVNLLDVGDGGIHIASGVPSSTSMALYNNSGTLTWNGIALATGSSVSGTTNYIPVFTGSNSLGDSVIYQSGSDVSIGTTSTGNPLTVSGANSTTELLTTTGSTFGTGLVLDNTDGSKQDGLYFNDAGTTKWTLAKASTNTAFSLLDNANSKYFITANAGGSLVLGPNQSLTLSQSGVLTQTGQITQVTPNGSTAYGIANTSGSANYYPFSFSNSNGVVGSIAASGTATAYNTTSDRRLKERIGNTHLGLAELMQIPVRDFNYISDPRKTREQGFIAQELYKVYPSAVTVGGDDPKEKPWQIDYGRLTPLLLRAVQQQQEEISALKTELTHDEATITAMKSKRGM